MGRTGPYGVGFVSGRHAGERLYAVRTRRAQERENGTAHHR